jgi:hypothetical protein
LDNLRQHAQTVHINEEVPHNSLGAMARFVRQVGQARSDRVQLPPIKKKLSRMYAFAPNSDASRRNSASQVSWTLGSSPKQPGSRSGSVSSMQSEQGQNGFKGLFSRRSSVHSRASSGYQEIVFDSKSANSGSQASNASGRRGPLDAITKAAMNAVKRVGACWRCKFLRKSVSSVLYLTERDAKE